MSLPMTPVFCLIAIVPVLFLLTAIMKFGWGVARAAPIGMLLAGGIAVLCFKASPLALTLEAGKGIWNAATILLVIWPAVFSYELTCESKGFLAIRRGIQHVTKHELLQILILGWIFPSFLQGITGFGVAVAVGAPLLLSIGVTPFYSIIIVLLCHCWGATFGTLALAWEALIAQAGMNPAQNAQAAVIAAAMIWFYNFLCVVISCWLYGKGKALKEAAPVMILISLIMGGGELLLAPVNATISFFFPAAVALGAVFLISRHPRYQRAWSIPKSGIMDRSGTEAETEAGMGFHQAFLPYYLLTVMTVICLLISPVNRILSRVSIGFAFPQTVTGYGFVTEASACFSPLKPLTYAGTFLCLSSLVTYCYYSKKGYIAVSGLKQVWKRTVQKCSSSTIAILCLIIMSKFMGSSGQIYVLSQGVIALLGSYYTIAAPFFGMLGSFITSSNMSSNILLGNFQSTAAEILHINPAVTVALQTVGGVLGDAFAPGSVIMGISTTGCMGADSRILKTLVPVSAFCCILFGAVAFFVLC